MKNIEDYIVVFEGALTHAFCDAILEEFSNEEEWQKTMVFKGGSENSVDNGERTAETIFISYPDVIERNHAVRREIDDVLFAALASVVKEYNSHFPHCKVEQDSGYELLRYKEGQFYIEHTDLFKDSPRAVSCSFALNDDYEGGEWGFWNREKVLKLSKGSAILFPSNFMYPHEIMPVVKGTRYAIVTWVV